MQQIKLGYTPPGGGLSSMLVDIYSLRGAFRPDEVRLFPPVKNDYRDGTSDTQIKVAIPMITMDLEVGQFNCQVPMSGNYANDKQIQLLYWAMDNAKTIDLGMSPPSVASAVIGGSTALANGTYYYVVSAVDAVGETVAPDANEVSTVISNNATQKGQVNITTLPGAVSYRIYRSAVSHVYGASSFWKEVPSGSYSDDGTVALSTGTRRTSTAISVVLEDVSKFMNNWENAKQFSKHYIVRMQRSSPITTWP